MLVAIFLANHITCTASRKATRNKIVVGKLPKEIKDREEWRSYIHILLVYVVLILSTVTGLFAYASELKKFFTELIKLDIILIAAVVNILILEYLFCTTPLPPSERERRKQSKEMKNTLPVGSTDKHYPY